ncbi:hypothetical protein MICAB_2550008 [Microcystis aeruginosa PCC 9717]|uniref:Uncharacterized protein n=1 Tax=Microcystis aeruginosa PCC 9717 TaxID=1160286 RepID=I4FM65_MICAE|nr:hypothetical protein [Microcystis sp. LE19-59.1C]CCH96740.1 hypothetical protein MICAB_2550008 [Microcystis aeruginosa PCC 9717]
MWEILTGITILSLGVTAGLCYFYWRSQFQSLKLRKQLKKG